MESLGFVPQVLDIGGGFTVANFDEASKAIGTALEHNVKKLYPDVRVIAEPGRYFAEDVATFFTPIIGKRVRDSKREYWIADGLYGSFNCMLYDKQTPKIDILSDASSPQKFPAKIFGQTCDSFDELKYDGDCELPELKVGDWLMFPSFGAYTIAGATDFNGINMTNPYIFYV